MRKVYTLINSEGNNLTLDFKNINNLKLISFLNDGTGRVTYNIHIIDLMRYFQSKITLKELVERSSDEKFIFFDSDAKTTTLVNKNIFLNKISCGGDLFCNLPSGMAINGKKYDAMILNFFNPDYE